MCFNLKELFSKKLEGYEYFSINNDSFAIKHDNESTLSIFIDGSNDKLDWISNLRFRRKETKKSGVVYHQGFYEDHIKHRDVFSTIIENKYRRNGNVSLIVKICVSRSATIIFL